MYSTYNYSKCSLIVLWDIPLMLLRRGSYYKAAGTLDDRHGRNMLWKVPRNAASAKCLRGSWRA